MINNIKMIINGHEVQVPKEINEMLSQLLKGIQTPRTSEIERNFPRPILSQSHIIPRQIIPIIKTNKNEIICKDAEARQVLFELDQRLSHIEKYLTQISKEETTKEVVPKIKKPIKKQIVKKIPVKKEVTKKVPTKKVNIDGKGKLSKKKSKK